MKPQLCGECGLKAKAPAIFLTAHSAHNPGLQQSRDNMTSSCLSLHPLGGGWRLVEEVLPFLPLVPLYGHLAPSPVPPAWPEHAGGSLPSPSAGTFSVGAGAFGCPDSFFRPWPWCAPLTGTAAAQSTQSLFILSSSCCFALVELALLAAKCLVCVC